jgi:ATP-dependent Clp protease adaptor protein ClpS
MSDTDLIHDTKTRLRTEKPKPWQVVILNDDYTPMDFVTGVLQQVFNLNGAVAWNKMMEIHRKGQTVCGPFTAEIAESKATEVMDRATREGHPLLAKHQLA